VRIVTRLANWFVVLAAIVGASETRAFTINAGSSDLGQRLRTVGIEELVPGYQPADAIASRGGIRTTLAAAWRVIQLHGIMPAGFVLPPPGLSGTFARGRGALSTLVPSSSSPVRGPPLNV
jgi:hypothetical protein